MLMYAASSCAGRNRSAAHFVEDPAGTTLVRACRISGVEHGPMTSTHLRGYSGIEPHLGPSGTHPAIFRAFVRPGESWSPTIRNSGIWVEEASIQGWNRSLNWTDDERLKHSTALGCDVVDGSLVHRDPLAAVSRR